MQSGQDRLITIEGSVDTVGEQLHTYTIRTAHHVAKGNIQLHLTGSLEEAIVVVLH